MNNIDYIEVEQLACLMLNKDYDSLIKKYGEDAVSIAFSEAYGVELFDFWDILEDLIKFTPSWVSPLTGEVYQGFVVPEDGGIMRAIIKQRVQDNRTK